VPRSTTTWAPLVPRHAVPFCAREENMLLAALITASVAMTACRSANSRRAKTSSRRAFSALGAFPWFRLSQSASTSNAPSVRAQSSCRTASDEGRPVARARSRASGVLP